jgi:hypothetical protein
MNQLVLLDFINLTNINVMDASAGLPWFQIETDDLTGKTLVDHIFVQQQISYIMDEKAL